MMNNTFYNEILTDHNLHPANKRKLEDANLVLEGVNPSCGDDLILELKESLGATVVIVTHELASIYAIANNSVFLDSESKTMLASGDPKHLLKESTNDTLIRFLTRGSGNREIRSI